MRQFIDKLRILVGLLGESVVHWRKEIWPNDLDEYCCCSGKEPTSPCGCYGVTYREAYGLGAERPTPADEELK